MGCYMQKESDIFDVLGKYFLVTACKNEAENLPKLIQSVAEQTIRPLVWVIVDDGSTDNTPRIIKEAKEEHSWIQSVRLDENSNRDLGFHLSGVMKRAFESGIDYCMKNGIDYEYIGNVDGDIIIEEMFFEKLIREFEKDHRLGIAGSNTQYIERDKIIQAKVGEEEPSGGDMLIRRECFEDCGGIQITWGWDGMLKAKAKIKGWKVKRFEYIKALETRYVGSVEGYWKRYMDMGIAGYYFNINPIHAMIKGVMMLRKKPYYVGIAYLFGYFNSFIKRREQIEDEKIRRFFWNKWRNYL